MKVNRICLVFFVFFCRFVNVRICRQHSLRKSIRSFNIQLNSIRRMRKRSVEHNTISRAHPSENFVALGIFESERVRFCAAIDVKITSVFWLWPFFVGEILLCQSSDGNKRITIFVLYVREIQWFDS